MRPKSPVVKKKVNLSLALVTIGRINKLARRLKIYKSGVIEKAVEEAYLREFKK